MPNPEEGCTRMIDGIMSGIIMLIIGVVCMDLLHMIPVA